MNTAVKSIAAFVFVALLGLVLTIPLRSGNPGPGPPRVAAAPSPEPSPDEMKAARREASGPLRSKRLEQSYPRACLRPVDRPEGGGSIAVHDGPRVVIADTNGTQTATIRPNPRIPPPVAWSPSGRFVAIGPQGLFWTSEGDVVLFANGEFSHGMVQGSTGRWAWSPVADCGVAIEDDFKGALQANHIDPHIAANVRLINEGVESFAYSRDGRSLGLVLKEGRIRSIWIVDLARNRMQEVRRFRGAICCITLAGWSTDDRDLLYWAAPGASVAADGWELRSVSPDGSSARWGATLPSPDALEECGDRILAIVGGNRFRQGNRLAILRRDRPPLPITPRADHSELTCARSGSLIAAARGERLVLLNGEGPFVRFLTQVETANGVFGESLPEWGPPGTGILFERHMHLIRQLWYIAEGGTTRFLTHLQAHRRLLLRHQPGALFDWSATPPDGLPAG